jgi:hypothetical protein
LEWWPPGSLASAIAGSPGGETWGALKERLVGEHEDVQEEVKEEIREKIQDQVQGAAQEGVRRAAFDGEEGEDVLEEEREIHEEVQACDHFLHPKC